MPKRGDWGDRMRIITPVLYKRVTCATCIHYCREDCSCVATPILPQIDGYDHWKICKQFELAPAFQDEKHIQQVIYERGKLKKEHSAHQDQNGNKRLNTAIVDGTVPITIPTEAKTVIEKFISAAWYQYGLEFCKLNKPNQQRKREFSCFLNKKKKKIAIVVSYLHSQNSFHHEMSYNAMITKRWAIYADAIEAAIRVLSELNDYANYEKWIVAPRIELNENLSYGEMYVQRNIKKLKEIQLAEISDKGRLIFVLGDIEK